MYTQPPVGKRAADGDVHLMLHFQERKLIDLQFWNLFRLQEISLSTAVSWIQGPTEFTLLLVESSVQGWSTFGKKSGILITVDLSKLKLVPNEIVCMSVFNLWDS